MTFSDEISRLVELLGSGDTARDEQALALLALHGRKPVEGLLAAAASTDPRKRAAVVTALGRIGDPRGRRSITLALADRNPAVRAAAATALSAHPTEESVTRLRGMLEREIDVEVRLRAAATLVDMFNSGTVEALDPLLALLHNAREDRHVRLEALKVLSSLPPSEARAIAAGLLSDQDTRLAQAALRFTGPPREGTGLGTREALAELDSPDYFTYRRAATLLASMGEAAIPTLVASLRARAADAVSCARVGSVLREVARGRERTVARYLDEVEDVVPLGLMVDILGESRDRTALYHLKGVIDRLESERAAASTPSGSGLARDMIIAKAHYYLARAGSRVAFDSLKEILADVARGRALLMGEILMAVQEIGGREELLDLVALYGREDGWMKERIREAFRRMMKKARISPEDPIFGRLDENGRAVLEEILSGPEPHASGVVPPAARRRPRHVDTH